MAKHLNLEFRDRLLNYIEEEFYKFGEPFEKTLEEISGDLNVAAIAKDYLNMTNRYLKMLEKSGNIKIYRHGRGSNANEYEFITRKNLPFIAETIDKNKNFNEDIEEITENITRQTQDTITIIKSLGRAIQDKNSRILFLEQQLRKLEYSHQDPVNRRHYFKGTHDDTLYLLVEELKEYENIKERAV